MIYSRGMGGDSGSLRGMGGTGVTGGIHHRGDSTRTTSRLTRRNSARPSRWDATRTRGHIPGGDAHLTSLGRVICIFKWSILE